ncbi:histidine phosphatase family protein [Candidatus Poriferisocius sp.]|uniref:histidine phosphatase family protein n=1 Tax=Candidatus Poriferisocius sp. TaxID=3101276 RepID=UPI003B012A70
MSSRPRTRLLLIRHGESQVTVKQIIGGDLSCTGLSHLGRRQAQALSERWARGYEPNVDALWASTLPRAVETAELLSPALGGLLVQTHVDLVERRPGEADGVGYEEFGSLFEWTGDFHPHIPLAPGGESLATFSYRTGRALYELIEGNPGTTMMVVCHGGVIDVAMRLFMGLGMSRQFVLWTLNTSITEFVATDDPGVWQLARYNDAAHLAGLSARTEPADRSDHEDRAGVD